MSTKIRLARGGTKKRPFYRIVVANSRSPRDGKFIVVVGTYNPLLSKENAERCNVDVALAQEWLTKGAQPTDRVAKIFELAGIKLPESVQKRLAQVKSNPKKAPKKEAKEGA